MTSPRPKMKLPAVEPTLAVTPITCMLVAVAILFAGVVPVSQSHAGTYDVAVCANPDTGLGTGVSPNTTASADDTGWQFIRTGGVNAPTATVTCPQSGVASTLTDRIRIAGNAAASSTDNGELRFTAPVATQITGYELYRQSTNPNQWSHSIGVGGSNRETCAWAVASCNLLWASLFGQNPPVGTTGGPFNTSPPPTGKRVQEAASGMTLTAALTCNTAPCAAGALIDLFGARIALEDLAPPSPSDVSGSIFDARPIHATETVAFDATDTGAGIYRAVVYADGTPVSATTVDQNSGRCVDVNPAGGDAFEFAWPRPCVLATTDRELTLNLDGIADGTHTVEVRLQDAAGNESVLYPATARTVEKSFSVTFPEAPVAVPNQAISFAATAAHVAPVTFSLENNRPLPQGLVLNTTTGEISGTPAYALKPTRYRLIMQSAADPTRTATAEFVLTVKREDGTDAREDPSPAIVTQQPGGRVTPLAEGAEPTLVGAAKAPATCAAKGLRSSSGGKIGRTRVKLTGPKGGVLAAGDSDLRLKVGGRTIRSVRFYIDGTQVGEDRKGRHFDFSSKRSRVKLLAACPATYSVSALVATKSGSRKLSLRLAVAKQKKKKAKTAAAVKTTSAVTTNETTSELLARLRGSEANWWLHNDGATKGSTRDADIDYPEAVQVLGPLRGPPTVAVIDSGISAAAPIFNGRLVAGCKHFEGGQGLRDGCDEPEASNESYGHGTKVASVIAQAVPGLRILPCNRGTGGEYECIKEILRRRAELNIVAVNLSYGQYRTIETYESGLYRQLLDAGIVPVASAGNEGIADTHYPSGSPDVVAVGASNEHDLAWDFSNLGKIDVAAPGVGTGAYGPEGDFGSSTGTSVAAPVVTAALGAAAWRYPNLRGAALREHVLSRADKIPALGSKGGRGRINLCRAVSDQPDVECPLDRRSRPVVKLRAASVRVEQTQTLDASQSFTNNEPRTLAGFRWIVADRLQLETTVARLTTRFQNTGRKTVRVIVVDKAGAAGEGASEFRVLKPKKRKHGKSRIRV